MPSKSPKNNIKLETKMLFYLLKKCFEMFRIQLDNSKSFKKDWIDLDRDLIKKKKVKSSLEKLADNPWASFLNIKKLQPKSDNKFRLKVDEYRIIYSIDFGNKIIIIHRI